MTEHIFDKDNKLLCQSCGQAMKVVSSRKHKLKTKPGFCRVTIWQCELCEIRETIYANGDYDLYQEPHEAIRDGKTIENDYLPEIIGNKKLKPKP